MKSKTKNYVIAGLTTLLILLGPVIWRKSMILRHAEKTVQRMAGHTNLSMPVYYRLWKGRVFIQGKRNGDAVSVGMVDGREVLVLYYTVEPNDTRF